MCICGYLNQVKGSRCNYFAPIPLISAAPAIVGRPIMRAWIKADVEVWVNGHRRTADRTEIRVTKDFLMTVKGVIEMNYEEKLWAGKDPLFAPGLQKGKTCYWRPTKKLLKAGYPIKSVRLKGSDLEIAQKCRDLSREAAKWFEAENVIPAQPRMKYYISRYQGDKYSPMQKVKQNTRRGYLQNIKTIENIMGEVKASSIDFPFLAMLEEDFHAKGRSLHYVHKLFTQIRMIINYMSALQDPEALRIASVLSKMRIQTPPKRNVAPTRQEIMAIVRESDTAGEHMFSLGLLLQWCLALRAVDVRGQWLKGHGGVERQGKYWQDGLTWKMFNSDMTEFQKIISKTQTRNPEPTLFSLRSLPDVRARLKAIPREGRVGPVIIQKTTGLPYSADSWSKSFRRHRDRAGVSRNIRMMDTRAGAITEASVMGANPFDMRDAAGHTQLSTTDRYARGKCDAIERVVELRFGE